MNDIMSYQYPPPGTPPPPYNGYPVALHMAGMGMRSPDQPGRNGSPNLSFDLKRANSRPNIKTDPDSEDSNMASADNKKRHKLMYHRAAAACTNCRRRKIRCQVGEPSQDDNKCLTCHKLSKDCKFESVNAGSPTESRHPSISRASGGHRLASASSSSSPAISSGHTIDIHAAQHHGSMTMPPIHQMGLSDSPGLKMEPGINRYPEYGSQGIATGWMGPDSAASSSSRTKHGSWGTPYDTTPMTPNFPPYPNAHHSHHHQQQQQQQNTHHAPPTPHQAWGPTTAPESGWGGGSSSSAYPPPTPSSSFSPLASSYVDRTGGGNKTPAVVMPAAEMYPPIPTMDQHSHHGGGGGGASSSSPGSAVHQAGGGAYGGGWQQQQQAYPPIKTEGGGGWYGGAGVEGGSAHGQAGMPVTDGYYTQR